MTFHSCALLLDNAGRCWGNNVSGQLGNGNTTDSSAPVAVTGLTGATAVSGVGVDLFDRDARLPLRITTLLLPAENVSAPYPAVEPLLSAVLDAERVLVGRT
jgi:hypothetical protein